ncbi:MAG: decaprenyl-phosphate phosphoribosyltransferase [candidate division WOR-3 bacterium]|nr:decaprenyl-phosphate phosphoribosyltransferase [candidate division WOR-3 bacterium]
MIAALFVSLRPKQWSKNLLVFAGLVFSRNLFNPTDFLRSLAGFVAFCLLSSAVYLINDLADVESDRLHPLKRFRPIASGRLKPGPAKVAAVVAAALALVGGWALDWRFGVVGLTYFLMQLAYSFGLKRMVVLDVMTVAAGFALRAVAGTVLVHVTISSWLFVCTILGALFIALAKRRHELLFLESGGTAHRAVLEKYSEPLLDQMMAVATSSTVIAYCLYTIAPETVAKFGTHNLMLTVPFVLYGVYRYLYLVYRKEMGGAPEKVLLTDVPLIVDGLLWAASVVAVLYLKF